MSPRKKVSASNQGEGEMKNPSGKKPAASSTRKRRSPSKKKPDIVTPVEGDEVVDLEVQPCPYDLNLLERARTQWQFGDWESLAQLDRDTLQNHPDRAELALLAAAGHLQTGNNSEARQFVRLAQDWGCGKQLISRILIAGVHNSLGRASAVAGRQTRAIKHFENAISIGTPGSDAKLLTQARSGYQLSQVGIETLANGQLRFSHPKASSKLATLKRQPTAADRARYLNQNGETLYKEGQYKLALEYFERALELAPDNAWICQNLAEAAARLNFKKGDQWECEQLAETIYETGKWDVAVRHYRRALKLNPAQVEAHRQAQTFAVEPAQADHIDNPIFIVGCGHSGTSLMLAILGNHPRINPIPKESAIFLKTDAGVQKALREWDAECKAQGKARWAEKTPPHIFQIHRFLAFRPKAQFIIVLRDGRDVVCSLKPRIGYAAFEDRLDRWIYDNMAGLPYWQHPQVKVVKYEDLVANTEATLRELCQFLGEEYSSQLLDYHKTEHRWYSDKIEKPYTIKSHDDHNTNRNWQINQPIFDGRGRWLAEMTETEKQQFKDAPSRRLLEQFGYAEDKNW
jgi:tetratricopeptide (TPR) repeat protein